MTAKGGAQRIRRILVLSLFGCLIAATLVLGHEFFGAHAAEAVGSTVPSVSTPVKRLTPNGTGAAGAALTRDNSVKIAKSKHPLPAPPKPIVLSALESLTHPTLPKLATMTVGEAVSLAPAAADAEVPSAAPALADEPKLTEPAEASHGVATSLNEGEAEVFQTGSSRAQPSVEATASTVAIAVPRPTEPQSAAAQPARSAVPTKKSLRVGFTPGAADLPESAAPAIDEIAALMSQEPSLRLQLLAFATATTENASQSRRLSLNRALAVRSALIDAGVHSTRIDVRALGSQTDEKPTDRVDILVVQHGGG